MDDPTSSAQNPITAVPIADDRVNSFAEFGGPDMSQIAKSGEMRRTERPGAEGSPHVKERPRFQKIVKRETETTQSSLVPIRAELAAMTQQVETVGDTEVQDLLVHQKELQLFSVQRTMAAEGKFKTVKNVAVGASLALIPVITKQIGADGVAQAMIDMGPGTIMGATIGKGSEPITRAVNKFVDTDTLSPRQKKVVQAGNAVVGGVAGGLFGVVGGGVGEHVAGDSGKAGANMIDDAIVIGGNAVRSLADKGKQATIKLRNSA